MPLFLIVTRAFESRVEGDVIEDAAEIARVEREVPPSHFVRVASGDDAPAPATAAASEE